MSAMAPKYPKFLFSMFVDDARNRGWPESACVERGQREWSLQAKSDHDSWITIVRNDTLAELDDAVCTRVKKFFGHLRGYSVWGRGEAILDELTEACPNPWAALVSQPDGDVLTLAEWSEQRYPQ